MKVTVGKSDEGYPIYVAKKDLEEPIVQMEKEGCGAAGSNSPTAGGLTCRQ